MTREMMKRVQYNQQKSADLVRYANPRKLRIRPSKGKVMTILQEHIPYSGRELPSIEKFEIAGFNRNPIQRSAKFIVTLVDGKRWEITAYERLKGRTPEEREQDKNETFPSELFTIFHIEL